ncbi:hypothetical protein B0H10DRAFT_2377844 [Mycena sp. CBHHK59/15]|nr:hypothetical protein B0H10DRAFT_2377844 [Mycena sp. CBHHK59/15]
MPPRVDLTSRHRARTPTTSMDPIAEDYELLLPSESSSRAGKALGQEDQLPISEGRRGDRIALHLALVFMAVTWVTVLVNDPVTVGWFAFHPLLQSLSIVLFTYGILTLQPTSQPKTKAAGLARHQYAMLLVAFPSIFFGTFAVMYNKWLHGKDHFVSWHGTFGIICMGWILVQILLGGGSVWFGAKAKAIWKYHRVSGYVLFMLLILTANLGGQWSGWSNRYVPVGLRIIAYTVAPLACLFAIYARVRLSKMKFF